MTDSLNGKTVLVLGFARQGKALARWLPGLGARVIVSDRSPADSFNGDLAGYGSVQFVMGGHPLALLDHTDVLCVSGGVPLNLPIIQAAVERGIRLTNDAQLFLERCPAPVIGITGSAGKTTTTTLTGEMNRLAGHKTWVGGNIGDVLLDVIDEIQPDDRVVMELSSFQLEVMDISPALGAVLNITPNHLDRHETMENYIRAKAQMILHQHRDDIAVLGRDDVGSRSLEQVVKGDLCWFSMNEMVANGAFLAGQRLIVAGDSAPDGGSQVICEREDIPLRGDHNVLNVLAASAIAGATGIHPDIMREAIRTFKGVPHRLEVVRVLGDVTYINDSIATAPERVIAALRSYEEPLVLLAGGKDKKLPWEEMIALALQKTRMIVAFGDAAELIVETVRRVAGNEDGVTRVSTLPQALDVAVTLAQPGDVVLLSPGGTSYDAYEDFVERGEHFRQLVMAL